MSKLTVLVLGAAVAALIYGGVFEIKIHLDRLSLLPSRLAALAKNKAAIEQGRVYLTQLKRRGEQLLIQDKKKRLELAVLNVQQDADRLQDLAADTASHPSKLLPQARLLLSSIDAVRDSAENAPVEAVATLKQRSLDAFQAAHKALGSLKELHSDYQALQAEFGRLTGMLEQQIGKLEFSEPGATAGATTGQKDQPKIPLEF
ncbi:MAG: hypothetical protein HY372_01380 [Candidatus Andersenbacteria bacterium]|nr:hypothetical protein [Candidatus Andersenbacteria bacterium]